MPTEKAIVNQITKYLDTLSQIWYFKVHGGPFQLAGVPDLVGCYGGRFFGIEVKRDYTEKPTLLQRAIINKIHKAGGLIGVARSVDDAKRILAGEFILDSLCESPIEELFWQEAQFHIPALEAQYKIGSITVDFALPPARLAIEIDGKAYHTSEKALERDSKRDLLLQQLGWRVVRFSGSEVYQDTMKCVAKVIQVMQGV